MAHSATAVGPRLAGMMFLQYFGLGAWAVPLTLYLQAPAGAGGMAFSPTQAGLIYSTFAFGGLLAPLFVGLLADRYFAAEKLLTVLHVAMAGLLYAAGDWCAGHDGPNAAADVAVGPLFGIMFGYGVCCLITLALTNVMAFRNLDDGRKFGYVRLVGTFGFIVGAVASGWFVRKTSSDALFLAAAGSAAMAAFSRVLPHTPPKGSGLPVSVVVGLPAVKLLRGRPFVAFAAAAFLGNAMNQFYVIFAPSVLKERGVELDLGGLGTIGPGVIMTLGQALEIACMAATPWLVARYGLRRVMLVGLAGWVVRPLALASGVVPLMVFLAVPLHGWSYALFGMLGNVYLDREAPRHLRAGAQGLMTFLSGGPALLIGNAMAGRVVEANITAGVTDWPAVWLVPAVGCAIGFALFALFFREPPPPPPPEE